VHQHQLIYWKLLPDFARNIQLIVKLESLYPIKDKPGNGSFLVEFMYALVKHLAKVACP